MKKKHIWIYWTRPQDTPRQNLTYITQMLNSIQRARKHASDIVIYTDTIGKQVLGSFGVKDTMDPMLDRIGPEIPSSMFVYPKMFVLSQINEPVVYLDHDFVLGENFEYEPVPCDVVVESLEHRDGVLTNPKRVSQYSAAYQDLIFNNSQKLISFVDVSESSKFDHVVGYGCGYISVENIDVVRQWASESINLLKKIDAKSFSKEDNIIFDGSLLYYRSLEKGWNVKTLADNSHTGDIRHTHVNSLTAIDYARLMPKFLRDIEKADPVHAAKIWKGVPIGERKQIRTKIGFKNSEHGNVIESMDAETTLFKSLHIFIDSIFNGAYSKDNELVQLREAICIRFAKKKLCVDMQLADSWSKKLHSDYENFHKTILSIIKELKIDVNKLNDMFTDSSLGSVFIQSANKNGALGIDTKRGKLESAQRSRQTEAGPSVLQMAKNFGSAMKDFAGSGFLKVTKDQHTARMDICRGCEFWDAGARFGMGKCLKCGCTAAKQFLAVSACPIGKWNAITKEEVEKNIVNINGSTPPTVVKKQTVLEEDYNKRLDICRGCEFWDASANDGTGKCLKCGCATKSKLSNALDRCPIDKWLPIEYPVSDSSKEVKSP